MNNYPPNWFAMDYEEIQRYIRNEGLYTGNMVDRLCVIIEENNRRLQNIAEVLDTYGFSADYGELDEQLYENKELIADLRGLITELQSERANNV